MKFHVKTRRILAVYRMWIIQMRMSDSERGRFKRQLSERNVGNGCGTSTETFHQTSHVAINDGKSL